MISRLEFRPNKVAYGFTKNNDRNVKAGKVRITNPKHPDYNEDKARTINRLIVYGTNDLLASSRLFKFVKVQKPHPTDSGYFKDVYVLYKNRKKYKTH